jgi:hypothetical protein
MPAGYANVLITELEEVQARRQDAIPDGRPPLNLHDKTWWQAVFCTAREQVKIAYPALHGALAAARALPAGSPRPPGLNTQISAAVQFMVSASKTAVLAGASDALKNLWQTALEDAITKAWTSTLKDFCQPRGGNLTLDQACVRAEKKWRPRPRATPCVTKRWT